MTHPHAAVHHHPTTEPDALPTLHAAHSRSPAGNGKVIDLHAACSAAGHVAGRHAAGHIARDHWAMDHGAHDAKENQKWC